MLLHSALPNNKNLQRGFLEKVLSSMIIDDISMVVKNDDLALKIGESLFAKHGSRQKKYICQELRLLGRFVLTMRQVCDQEDGRLIDFLKPKKIDDIVKATQIMAGINEAEDANSFDTPSIGLKCGPLLKKCCIIMKGQALRQGDDILEKDSDRILRLIEGEWANNITSVALRSAKDKKRSQPVRLPTASDLQKLTAYVDSRMNSKIQEVSENPTHMRYFQDLSSVVLSKIIMLNRRRSGEESKLLLTDFVDRPNWKDCMNELILESMTAMERKLIER